MREDAFLGIERLAMEDITAHEPVETRPKSRGDAEDRDDADIGEEITSIVIGGDEEPMDQSPDVERTDADESEAQRKRRRRRRRGRRVKERNGEPDGAEAEAAGADLDDDRSEVDEDRPHRQRRPGVQKRRDEENGDDLEDDDDRARPNKNLHREVTPWAEAIGYIVSANMEARARSPGGGQRGRWGKGDRRG
jgi:hypothetical protein